MEMRGKCRAGMEYKLNAETVSHLFRLETKAGRRYGQGKGRRRKTGCGCEQKRTAAFG